MVLKSMRLEHGAQWCGSAFHLLRRLSKEAHLSSGTQDPGGQHCQNTSQATPPSTKPNQVRLSLGSHREEVPDLSPANTQACSCLLLKWNTLYLCMIYTLLPVLFKSSLTTYNNKCYVSDCISRCYTILALNLYFLSHDCTVFSCQIFSVMVV